MLDPTEQCLLEPLGRFCVGQIRVPRCYEVKQENWLPTQCQCEQKSTWGHGHNQKTRKQIPLERAVLEYGVSERLSNEAVSIKKK